MNLSDHFSLAEAVASETAERKNVDNTPSSAIISVMQSVAVRMEKIRILLGNKAIHINSWYRCPELNSLVGSLPSSQHIKGEAVDFICPEFGTPADICKTIIANKELVNFDQLILEHSWIHISFAIAGGKARGQVLSLLSNGSYSSGLTDKKGNKIE